MLGSHLYLNTLSVNPAPIKYRPIAFAPTLSKMFQKVMLNFLSSTLDAASDPLQFAYKKHRSPLDAVATLLHHTTPSLANDS